MEFTLKTKFKVGDKVAYTGANNRFGYPLETFVKDGVTIKRYELRETRGSCFHFMALCVDKYGNEQWFEE